MIFTDSNCSKCSIQNGLIIVLTAKDTLRSTVICITHVRVKCMQVFGFFYPLHPYANIMKPKILVIPSTLLQSKAFLAKRTT